MWILKLLVALGLTWQTSGEFVITHAPDYLKFLDSDKAGPISTSDIPKLVKSTIGYSVTNDMKWKGLAQTTMFRRPKASVLFSIDGHQQPLSVQHYAKYECNVDDGAVETESVVNAIESVATDSQPLLLDFSVDNTIFDIKSDYPNLFGHLPATFSKLKDIFGSGKTFTSSQLRSLNVTRDADLLFLGELFVIRQIATALKQQSGRNAGKVPDFYHFKVSGLSELRKIYGEKSPQVQDAQSLLENLINEVTADFKQLYNNNVVVQVVTLPPAKAEPSMTMRYKRNLLQQTTEAPSEPIEEQINYGPDYYWDYPAVFNIILWTMVILIFALVFISVGLWFMDPGRDSIIYRMTSQRIKKE